MRVVLLVQIRRQYIQDVIVFLNYVSVHNKLQEPVTQNFKIQKKTFKIIKNTKRIF